MERRNRDSTLNGEAVSIDQIKKMKAKSHRKYMAAIEKNNLEEEGAA